MTKELIEIITIFSNWVEEVGSNFNKKKELILFYNTLDDEKPLIKMDFSKDSIYYFGFGNILYDKNIDEWDKKNINNRIISAEFYNLFLVLNTYGKNFFEKKNKSIINSFFNFYKEYYILFDWITTTKYNIDKLKIYKFDGPDFIIETKDEIIPVEVSIAEGSYSHFYMEDKNVISGLSSLPPKVTNYEEISEENIKNIERHLKRNNNYKENIKKYFSNKKIIDTLYLFPLGNIDRIFDQEIPSMIKIIKKTSEIGINLENIFVRIYCSHNRYYNNKIWNSLEKIKWIANVKIN